MGRVRNEKVCRKPGIERMLVNIYLDQRVWFGHMARINEYRRVLMGGTG